MGIFSFLRHPLLMAGITIPEFLRWYFMEEPVRIVRRYLDYMIALSQIFAFGFLLKTLFAPWRQISDAYESRGFNLTRFAEALTLNIVSRTIGFLFRVISIACGLFVLSIFTLLFAMYYLSWLLFPILFWMGISYVFSAFA